MGSPYSISVLKMILLSERGSESGGFCFCFLLERTHWLYGVCVCVGACCVCVCTLLDCTYLDLCILCAMGCLRMAMWLLIINHTSPMIPVLSVYWMVMCSGMQIQSALCILFKQSHLISYSWVWPGRNMSECTGFHKMFRVLQSKNNHRTLPNI